MAHFSFEAIDLPDDVQSVTLILNKYKPVTIPADQAGWVTGELVPENPPPAAPEIAAPSSPADSTPVGAGEPAIAVGAPGPESVPMPAPIQAVVTTAPEVAPANPPLPVTSANSSVTPLESEAK